MAFSGQGLTPDEERLGWLWLARVMGPASARSKELLEVYGTAQAVYRARLREDFSPYLTDTQADRLHSLSLEDCLPEWAKCQRAGIRLLAIGDAEYPKRFLSLPDPPLLLYATGDVTALKKGPVLSLVGSRRPSAYGEKTAHALAEACAKAGAVMVSGLADGLDSEAHKAALEANSPTVGFLGCAIDRTYPASNRPLRARVEANGAVFSEYGPGEKGLPTYFLQRNRLIAAACDVLCVVEARAQSGTMNTVHHALRYGRPVYAVPGDIFSPQSEGTNALIADGSAKPVTGPESLLSALKLAGAAQKAKKLPAEKLPEGEDGDVLACLQKGGSCTLGQLCEALHKAPGQMLVCLTRLEMAGLVRSLGGAYSLR